MGKGQTLLHVVNKPLNTKSLLTMPSNVLPLRLKQTFLPIIWIFTEGDAIKSRLPLSIFSTLSKLCFVTLVSFPIAAEAAIYGKIQNYLREVFNTVSQQPCYWSTTWILVTAESYSSSEFARGWLCSSSGTGLKSIDKYPNPPSPCFWRWNGISH